MKKFFFLSYALFGSIFLLFVVKPSEMSKDTLFWVLFVGLISISILLFLYFFINLFILEERLKKKSRLIKKLQSDILKTEVKKEFDEEEKARQENYYKNKKNFYSKDKILFENHFCKN